MNDKMKMRGQRSRLDIRERFPLTDMKFLKKNQPDFITSSLRHESSRLRVSMKHDRDWLGIIVTLKASVKVEGLMC